MSLETIIPPEIHNDEFATLLTQLAGRKDVKTILEVGSSSGEGSTQAIVDGMDNGEKRLYCIEMSETRFDALCRRFVEDERVRPFHGSSVTLDGYLSEGEVKEFYETTPTNLNAIPLKTVLDWLDNDILACNEAVDDLIEMVKDCAGVTKFDLVLLDGSPFTGWSELQHVMGSRIIALDDVMDIKHHRSYHALLKDNRYKLLKENLSLRNGFAVFEIVK